MNTKPKTQKQTPSPSSADPLPLNEWEEFANFDTEEWDKLIKDLNDWEVPDLKEMEIPEPMQPDEWEITPDEWDNLEKW